MAEAPRPKYDNLPGIDTAPDVYETPELAEDVSTIQASTAVSESEDDSDSQNDENAVRHSRLQPENARSRFHPSRVDARGVDFSDNIGHQRRSYRTSTRGRRRRDVYGDDSGDEKESFSRRLLRIKREVEELSQEFETRVQTGDKSKIEEKDPKEVMEYISNAVDTIYTARRGGVRGAEPLLERTMAKFRNYPPFLPSRAVTKAIESAPPLPGTQIQRNQLEFVLDQAADFDKRLSGLEKSLGLNGSTMPDISEKSVFPVYTKLAITEASVELASQSGKLDETSKEVKRLLADAERVKELRQENAKSANAGSDAKGGDGSDQEAKINALYGTLPTIDKLSPILPLVLERLRTLRLVHTSAWEADEILKELEERQARQEDEIKKWEASLKTVDENMVQCEERLEKNMKTIGSWVKEMEERISKLPGQD